MKKQTKDKPSKSKPRGPYKRTRASHEPQQAPEPSSPAAPAQGPEPNHEPEEPAPDEPVSTQEA